MYKKLILHSRIRTFFLFVLVFAVHYWFITFGTWNLFALTPYGDNINLWNGACYDSLAKSLLLGNSTVESSTILWEAFNIKGNTYMYFGPFPALLRLIPNIVFPCMYGKWARISCLLASALCLLAFLLIVFSQLIKNKYLTEKDKFFFLDISLLSFGLGTPLLILTIHPFVYNEAILWGLCWSMWSMYFAISFISYPDNRYLKILGLSFSSGCALLSRVTFGVSAYLILLILIIKYMTDKFISSQEDFKKIVLKHVIVLMPALIALSFQLWYNYDRFGSVTKFIDYTYYSDSKYHHVPVDLINPQRIQTFIINFFGFRKEYFSNKPPYVVVPYAYFPKPEIFYVCYGSRAISLIVVSPWLIIGAAMGAIMLFTNAGMLVIKLCGISYLLNWFILFTYIGIIHRYSNEFLPFLVFMYSYLLLNIGKQNFYEKYKSGIMLFIIFISTFSIIATLLSDLGVILDNVSPPEMIEKVNYIFNSIQRVILLIK